MSSTTYFFFVLLADESNHKDSHWINFFNTVFVVVSRGLALEHSNQHLLEHSNFHTPAAAALLIIIFFLIRISYRWAHWYASDVLTSLESYSVKICIFTSLFLAFAQAHKSFTHLLQSKHLGNSLSRTDISKLIFFESINSCICFSRKVSRRSRTTFDR